MADQSVVAFVLPCFGVRDEGGLSLDDLEAGDTVEKCQALKVIADMGTNASADLLDEVLPATKDRDAAVRANALMTLGKMGTFASKVAHSVWASEGDGDISVRCAAIEAVGMVASADEFASRIASILSNDAEDPEVRASAATALGSLKATDYSSELAAAVQDNPIPVIISSLTAIGCWQASGADLATAITGCLQHTDRRVRAAALNALAQVGDETGAEAAKVAEKLTDSDNMVRAAAVEYFRKVREAGAVVADEVAKNLEHQDCRFQASSALALGYMGMGKYTEPIAKLLTSTAQDEYSPVLALAGAEPKLDCILRRPCCAAARALAEIGDGGNASADKVASLIGGALPTEAEVSIVLSLGMFRGDAAPYIPALRETLDSSSALIRAAACSALAMVLQEKEDEETAEALSVLLEDSNATVREKAVTALASMPDQGSKYARDVHMLFGDRVYHVQIAAMKSMTKFDEVGQMYATEVCRLMFSDVPAVREAAAEVLSNMGERGAAFADEVAELLNDTSGAVRLSAVKALANMGDDARPFLVDVVALQDDPLDSVRQAAEECLSAFS